MNSKVILSVIVAYATFLWCTRQSCKRPKAALMCFAKMRQGVSINLNKLKISKNLKNPNKITRKLNDNNA